MISNRYSIKPNVELAEARPELGLEEEKEVHMLSGMRYGLSRPLLIAYFEHQRFLVWVVHSVLVKA